MTENKGDLISRSALKRKFRNVNEGMFQLSRVYELIDNAPTVDTTFREVVAYECGQKSVERPHGKWIKHIDNLYPEDSTEECPFCHEEQRLVGNDDNFCPNCGAKMTKEAEE